MLLEQSQEIAVLGHYNRCGFFSGLEDLVIFCRFQSKIANRMRLYFELFGNPRCEIG